MEARLGVDVQRLQRRASLEGAVADAGDVIGDGDGGECAVALEDIAVDAGDRLAFHRCGYGDRSAVAFVLYGVVGLGSIGIGQEVEAAVVSQVRVGQVLAEGDGQGQLVLILIVVPMLRAEC